MTRPRGAALVFCNDAKCSVFLSLSIQNAHSSSCNCLQRAQDGAALLVDRQLLAQIITVDLEGAPGSCLVLRTQRGNFLRLPGRWTQRAHAGRPLALLQAMAAPSVLLAAAFWL